MARRAAGVDCPVCQFKVSTSRARRRVRDQVELYEGSGGTQGTTLRDTGLPVVIVTNVGASSGKVRRRR